VIDRREGDGGAWKCTLCYDRLKGGMEPACAKAYPTDSIKLGDIDQLREIARSRVNSLHERGMEEATSGRSGLPRSVGLALSPSPRRCHPPNVDLAYSLRGLVRAGCVPI